MLEYCDQAIYLGEDLIIMKSPVNGVLILRPTFKDEFVPIKSFAFHQNILDAMSHLCLCQEFIVAGDSAGGALIINMRTGIEKRVQLTGGST